MALDSANHPNSQPPAQGDSRNDRQRDEDRNWSAGLQRDWEEGRYLGPLGPPPARPNLYDRLMARAAREPMPHRFHHTYK